MKLHKMCLPSGQEITCGAEESWALIRVKVCQQVNRGSSFRLGSVCAAQAEIELFTPKNQGIPPGTEVTLYQGQEKLGLFTVETARRISPNRLTLFLRDRGHRLDKELTAWLSGLDWPCTLEALATGAARQCGLEPFYNQDFNHSLRVDKFSRGIVTGRQLLGWCAELMGCFCYVNPDGVLTFDRFRDSDLRITPTGENFYYGGSLSAGDVPQEDVVGVKLRDPKNPHLLPVYGDSAHTYTIEANPLSKNVEFSHLMSILGGFPRNWSNCVVTVPDTVEVRVGQYITVFDGERSYRMPVMERLLQGGRQTLSALGTAGGRVDSVSAQARALAQQLSIAHSAVDAQTQAEIFNRLTDNGNAQGLFLRDGQLYINASFLSAGILDAALVKVINLIAETVCSVEGESALRIDGASLTMTSGDKTTVELSNSAPGLPIFYMTDREEGAQVHRLELTPHHLRLGGTDPVGNLRLSAADGAPTLSLSGEAPKRLSWTWNASLGKYTLTGE